jgi:type III restriction enzyme
LNSVCLYLPYYNEKAVASVVKRLTDPDPEIGFPTHVQLGENLVTLQRNPEAKAVFEAAAKLETYVIEPTSKQSAIRRLLRLGRLLAWDKLDADALGKFTAALVAVLEAERKKVASKAVFKKALEEAAEIDVRAVTVAYGETTLQAETRSKLTAVSQNVEHAFAEAGRKLGAGLHLAYLHHRVAQKNASPVPTLKLELYALLQDPAVLKAAEAKAESLLGTALDKHKVARAALPDERRQLYRQVSRQAKRPMPEPWELPPSIDVSKSGNSTLKRHLYANDDGDFRCQLNLWEQQVIEEELSQQELVGWLRNEPRKQWAFAVPYSDGKEERPLYPDFLVFRKQGAGVVCDVLEPHSLDWADSPAKAAGLAEFAHELGDRFGRIELIAKVGQKLKRLRLDDIPTRDKVRGVKTAAHLQQLFDAA